MIRGNFENLNVEELNGSFLTRLEANASDEDLQKYCDYIGTSLYGSEPLRKDVIALGYKVIKLYPCYHQGWEMDEWGVIAEKGGLKFRFETNHGSLCSPIEYKETSLKRMIMTVLGFD